MVQRAETTVAECLPDELRVSSFPNRFQRYAWTTALSARSDFVGSRVYECLSVTCHLHFWQNYRGLLRATAVPRGVERTQNQSHHTKLTLEKKILPPLLPGFELATFRLRVRRSNQQAFQAFPAFIFKDTATGRGNIPAD